MSTSFDGSGTRGRPSQSLRAVEESPLTLLHLAIIILCACGFAIDLSELALGNILSVVFSAPPHRLSGSELSWLLSSVFLGSIAGAPLMGWVADRVGLKTVLATTLIWLSATSIMAGASSAPAPLILSRLLAGLALGAFPPLMISYLTDISPFRWRGPIIFATCAFAYLGPPAVVFGVRWLTPIQPWGVEGWRWPFLVGGGLCTVAGMLFFGAPEAPHWLEAVGRREALEKVAVRLRRSPRLSQQYRRDPATAAGMDMANISLEVSPVSHDASRGWRTRLPGVALLYFLIPWATVSFPLVTGPILLARHFSLSDALLYVGLATLGPVLGTVIGGLVVDRFDRQRFMTGCALAMLASIGLFFAGYGIVATAAGMILFGMFSAIYLPALTMFGAELFNARARGRATGLAWVANRVGATLAPLALVPLVRGAHELYAAGLICASLMANLIVLRLLR